MGRGRGQDFQVGTSGTQERVYTVVPQTKLVDKSDIQGMFRVSHFLCCLNSGASHSCLLVHLV